jgi:hypothetical protein
MTTADMEKRFRNLGDQLTEKQSKVDALVDAYGLTDQTRISEAEMASFKLLLSRQHEPQSKLQLEEMFEARRKEVESLPEDVRAGIAKASELVGPLVYYRNELISRLHSEGVEVAAVAKRLDISEDIVREELERSS